MDRADFRDLLAAGPLLADGGTGASLLAGGVRPDTCLDELNLTAPETVLDCHRAFVQAGAQLVETNTFGANRLRLARHGLEGRTKEINVAGARLARAAGARLVAGSVGPLGVRLAPYGRVQRAEAQAAFAEQIAALAEGGADLILIETQADCAEAEQAVAAARAAAPHLPVAVTLTFTRDDQTMLGETPAVAASRIAALEVDALGVNCSEGPAQVLRLVTAMRPHARGIPLMAQPNAGGPQRVAGRVIYSATPAYLAEHTAAYLEAGVRIIGGCCGTEPEHISAMAEVVRAGAGSPAPATRMVPADGEPPEPSDPGPPSAFAEALADGAFVVSVEMDPPRGFSAARLVAGAGTLADAGADAISVADSPMARMRMSPWAACHLIQQEAAIETVLHFPTRGRSLLRVQSDLLAAYALGIRTIFSCMGDPTAIGDVPGAADRADVTPSGLIALIKGSFNRGQDQGGASIGTPTRFVVGCALNLNARDLEREVRVLDRKIRAGADFALTQPVYDLDRLTRLRDAYEGRYGPLRLPVLVGVLPLATARHAEFLHNEVPGIDIPESVRERMRRATDPQAEGRAIAGAVCAAAAGGAAGIYLIPPFNRYDLAAELIEEVRAEQVRPPAASRAGSQPLQGRRDSTS